MTAYNTGRIAEIKVETYLRQQKCSILFQNYYSRYGEIDIIALHKHCLCFIEVRYRSKKKFGGALASITPCKQKRIIDSAKHFLIVHEQYIDYEMRFDVITIDGDIDADIVWLQSAFTL